MKSNFGWILKFGRLRIGYMSPHNWKVYGTPMKSWVFIFRNYKYRMIEPGWRIGGYFQFTILGFQVAFNYK